MNAYAAEHPINSTHTHTHMTHPPNPPFCLKSQFDAQVASQAIPPFYSVESSRNFAGRGAPPGAAEWGWPVLPSPWAPGRPIGSDPSDRSGNQGATRTARKAGFVRVSTREHPKNPGSECSICIELGGRILTKAFRGQARQDTVALCKRSCRASLYRSE